jgi:DNA-3-methyladenine glycosylase II
MMQETFWIDPLPPFRLDLTVWALRRRASNRIDHWDDTTYTRVLLPEGQPVKVSVKEHGPLMQPRLLVTAASALPLARLQARISSTLQRMLGCTVDVTPFYALARGDPQLRQLSERFLGLKPPRFPTLFEAFLNAFACQQVSLDVGLLLLNRLAETYGLSYADDQSVSYAFPGPEQLVNASVEPLRTLGWSRQKARAAQELAYLLVEGQLDVSRLETMSNAEVCRLLLPLRGVGRWSAEYILLRGLGRIDTFPGDDVGAQKNLQMLLGLDGKLTYEQVNTVTARWRPYAGFVYFHLLLHRLDQKGLLQVG